MVSYREIKLIRLDGAGVHPFAFAESGLDSPAFVCLENISLTDNEVEFSCLHAFAEYKVELEVDETRK